MEIKRARDSVYCLSTQTLMMTVFYFLSRQVIAEIQIRRRRIVEAPIIPATVRTGGSSRRVPEEEECPPWEERRFIDQPSQLPLCNQRYYLLPSSTSSSPFSLHPPINPLCSPTISTSTHPLHSAIHYLSMPLTYEKCNFPNGLHLSPSCSSY